MKIPARVAKSRHGVYYYRLQYTVDQQRKERRVSLHTKDPAVARVKVIELSAIMQKTRIALPAIMTFDITKFDPKDPSTWPETHVAKQTHDVRKMDVMWSADGPQFLNVNTEADANILVTILRKLNLSYAESASLSLTERANLLAGRPKDAPYPPPDAVPPRDDSSSAGNDQGGTAIEEVIKRFATRKKDKLALKTLYEYGNYHRIFQDWLEKRERRKNIPIRMVGRNHIADFIDDLKADNISDRTIQQKYLAAINGLFELAQLIGSYPQGPLPSRGHKVFTKKDQKSANRSSSYRPFTDDELTKIFDLGKLQADKRPADFWLPLLALFTGGRLSELCQLAISDIRLYEGTWSVWINDEDYKALKTNASERVLPLHPTLIGLGFLEYIEDAKQFGSMVFPYLTPDRFGSFGNTPGERFAKYLDKLEIRDSRKVFHSFRSTSNNRLKDNGVAEEDRCQFIGHEHATTNSAVYSDPRKLPFLLEHVASKLVYDALPFETLIYKKGDFVPWLERLCNQKTRMANHRAKRKN